MTKKVTTMEIKYEEPIFDYAIWLSELKSGDRVKVSRYSGIHLVYGILDDSIAVSLDGERVAYFSAKNGREMANSPGKYLDGILAPYLERHRIEDELAAEKAEKKAVEQAARERKDETIRLIRLSTGLPESGSYRCTSDEWSKLSQEVLDDYLLAIQAVNMEHFDSNFHPKM